MAVTSLQRRTFCLCSVAICAHLSLQTDICHPWIVFYGEFSFKFLVEVK